MIVSPMAHGARGSLPRHGAQHSQTSRRTQSACLTDRHDEPSSSIADTPISFTGQAIHTTWTHVIRATTNGSHPREITDRQAAPIRDQLAAACLLTWGASVPPVEGGLTCWTMRVDRGPSGQAYPGQGSNSSVFVASRTGAVLLIGSCLLCRAHRQ